MSIKSCCNYLELESLEPSESSESSESFRSNSTSINLVIFFFFMSHRHSLNKLEDNSFYPS